MFKHTRMNMNHEAYIDNLPTVIIRLNPVDRVEFEPISFGSNGLLDTTRPTGPHLRT